MKTNQFWAVASKALAVIAATLIMALILAPGAWAAGTYTVLYSFAGTDGAQPIAGLIFDSAGNLYGTTNEGGAYSAGTVFELTPTSGGGWTESVLYSFTGGADGANPVAGLIFDALGNLYSTTQRGGAYGQGTVFELTPTSGGGWTENVLYSFTNGADGGAPLAGLIFDAAGNLYGTTWEGAHHNSFCSLGCGVVFELTPMSGGGWTESVLHSFKDRSDGSNSWAGLIFDSAGNLYSVAWNGGRYGQGNVFKLTPNSNGTWTEHVLYQFRGGTDGSNPQGSLIFDTAGNLYGTTRNYWGDGSGIVFKLVPGSNGTWTKHTLHQFTGGKDGAHPDSGLILDAAGNLYGTALSGGAHGYGNAFELTPNTKGGWKEKVLHQLTGGADGSGPDAGLIFDAAGNLYGTASGGGTGNGVVFEITP